MAMRCWTAVLRDVLRVLGEPDPPPDTRSIVMLISCENAFQQPNPNGLTIDRIKCVAANAGVPITEGVRDAASPNAAPPWFVALVQRQVVASTRGCEHHMFVLSFESNEQQTRKLDPAKFLMGGIGGGLIDTWEFAPAGSWCLLVPGSSLI